METLKIFTQADFAQLRYCLQLLEDAQKALEKYGKEADLGYLICKIESARNRIEPILEDSN